MSDCNPKLRWEKFSMRKFPFWWHCTFFGKNNESKGRGPMSSSPSFYGSKWEFIAHFCRLRCGGIHSNWPLPHSMKVASRKDEEKNNKELGHPRIVCTELANIWGALWDILLILKAKFIPRGIIHFPREGGWTRAFIIFRKMVKIIFVFFVWLKMRHLLAYKGIFLKFPQRKFKPLYG